MQLLRQHQPSWSLCCHVVSCRPACQQPLGVNHHRLPAAATQSSVLDSSAAGVCRPTCLTAKALLAASCYAAAERTRKCDAAVGPA